MGWAVGDFEGRDIGYGVPAKCDHPDCDADIDRGLVDGQSIRVRGEREMDDTDKAMLTKVIAAAKRKLDADAAGGEQG